MNIHLPVTEGTKLVTLFTCRPVLTSISYTSWASMPLQSLPNNYRSTTFANCNCKANPLTGRGDPQVCETSRIPYFLDNLLTDAVRLWALRSGRHSLIIPMYLLSFVSLYVQWFAEIQTSVTIASRLRHKLVCNLFSNMFLSGAFRALWICIMYRIWKEHRLSKVLSRSYKAYY
jgi:hypothetical protein